MNKHLKKILTEMCKRVGIKFKDIDFTSNDWYWRHSWTKKEEASYKEWFIEYLYKDAIARKAIMAFPKKPKKHLEKVANAFLFNYGWKLKKETKNGKENGKVLE